MHTDDLFTAPQVAKICSTDLKTIHNWVNRNEIKSFRTPGRHLRFRRQDILEFLNRFGYPIPEGFSAGENTVVLVDRDDNSRKILKRSLSREFDVEAFASALDGAIYVGKQNPSLILINGDGGGDAVSAAEHFASSKDNSAIVALFSMASTTATLSPDVRQVNFSAETEGKDVRRAVMTLMEK